MIPAFEAYLFDVDGTLVDSALDICGAIQGVLAKTPAHDVTFEFLRGYIGRHLMDVFTDVLPTYSAQQIGELIEDYRLIYPARNHASTVVYPGVLEGLARLPGKKTTATTKGTPTTRAVLEKFGLLPFFHHVQGTDEFPAKPHPDVLFKAMEGVGAAAEHWPVCGRRRLRHGRGAPRWRSHLRGHLRLWQTRGSRPLATRLLDRRSARINQRLAERDVLLGALIRRANFPIQSSSLTRLATSTSIPGHRRSWKM